MVKNTLIGLAITIASFASLGLCAGTPVADSPITIINIPTDYQALYRQKITDFVPEESVSVYGTQGELVTGSTFTWELDTLLITKSQAYKCICTPPWPYKETSFYVDINVLRLKAPKISSISTINKGVVLKWSKPANIKNNKSQIVPITGYNIYRAHEKNDKVIEYRGTVGTSRLEYQDGIDSIGFNYYWKITAITTDSLAESEYSAEKINQSGLGIENLKLEATQGTIDKQIKLTWPKIQDYTYAQVFCLNDGEPQYSLTKGSGNSCTYLVPTRLLGTPLLFSIKMSKNETDTHFSHFVYAEGWSRHDVPRALKLHNSIEGVNLSWTKPKYYESVDGYIVLRYEKKFTTKPEYGAVFFNVNGADNLTFTDSTGVYGKNYYYCVSARGKLAQFEGLTQYPFGKWTGALTGRRLMPTTDIVGAEHGMDYASIDVRWNTVWGASCYRVYRALTPDSTQAKAFSGWLKANTFTDKSTSLSTQDSYYYFVKVSPRTNGAYASDFSIPAVGWLKSKPFDFTLTSGGMIHTFSKNILNYQDENPDFTASPSAYGQYADPVTPTKISKISFRMNSNLFPSDTVGFANISSLWMYKSTVYNKAINAGIYTDTFLQDTSFLSGQLEEYPIDVWVKTSSKEKGFPRSTAYRTSQVVYQVPPTLDTASRMSVIDGETYFDLRYDAEADTFLMITGENFGQNKPKVWIEYKLAGKTKVYKTSLTVSAEFSKQPLTNSLYTQADGYSAVNVKIPKSWAKKQPWGDDNNIEAYLVISTGRAIGKPVRIVLGPSN